MLFCSLGQLLKQSVSVWRWRRHKERDTHCRTRGEQRHHVEVSHPHNSLQSFLYSLREEGKNTEGSRGESKNVHLHPPGPQKPPPLLYLLPICCKNLPPLCPPPLPPAASLPWGAGLISLSDGLEFCL